MFAKLRHPGQIAMRAIRVRRLSCLFLIFYLSLAAAATACSEKPVIQVAIDEARLVRLDSPASTIIVGNPAIAEVTAGTGALLVVTGKSFGETNLIVLNAKGEEILEGKLSVGNGTGSFVSVYRGAQRQTLYCTPLCEKVISPGDDPKNFDETISATAKKLDMGKQAATAKTNDNQLPPPEY